MSLGDRPTPDPISVEVVLDHGDHVVLTRSTAIDRRRPGVALLQRTLRVALWIALVVAAGREPVAWIAVALLAGIVLLDQWLLRKGLPRAYEVLDGRYEVSSDGLRRINAISVTTLFWPAVENLGSTRTHVVVRFSGSGWVIPHRCFTSDEHRVAFLEAASHHRATASLG